MTTTKSQLKQIIPLYSDLADLLLEFLEPCLDYSVSTCPHKNAFCQCGNVFEFRTTMLFKKIVLLEKFCPFCGTENPHTSRIQENALVLKRSKKHLRCPRCFIHAESYDHKFCSTCQHKYEVVNL
jgi:hypothetical protein